MTILTLLLRFLFADPATAWGFEGHRIVCEIAIQEMNQQTRDKVNALIARDSGFNRFADSCVWADLIRDSVRANRPSYQKFGRLTNAHFVNIPRRAPAIDQATCTRMVNGVANPCVIDAVREFAVKLKQAVNDQERLEALKLVSHFVGDIHQPLHAGYPDDLGGNTAQVRVGNNPTMRSLHAIWDSYLVQQANKPWPDYALELQRDINPVDRTLWSANLDPLVWATESFQIVEDDVYEDLATAPGNVRVVDDRYYQINQLTVERRLKQAGIRLARTLEAALAVQ
jgi:hypothetical protein